ncbi:hypothetical protein CRG98_008764 [Punica granatum]|uniref:Uncharacterized protein n=1 Tax=Punica granatum TaxID=22663 RepID=A0A2I0KRE7_PUNGR|nr:hypothetical protein CRG98_008764 [Punica granatum]
MFSQEARDNPMFAQEARDDPMFSQEARDNPMFAQEARDDPMFSQEARDNPMFAQEAWDDPMVASECGCKAAVLRIRLTLGTATRLVAWECEKRGWFTCKDNVDLLRIGFTTCNSSSGDERLRIPWNWESEYAVVLTCL